MENGGRLTCIRPRVFPPARSCFVRGVNPDTRAGPEPACKENNQDHCNDFKDANPDNETESACEDIGDIQPIMMITQVLVLTMQWAKTRLWKRLG